MDLKVMPGKMTKLEKEANTYGQIHCVDVSTYKEVEWVQEKRRKCTSSFPKKAIEKTETVSKKIIFRPDHPLKYVYAIVTEAILWVTQNCIRRLLLLKVS